MAAQQRRASVARRFGEKSFYLDEFRGQTLMVALPGEAVERPKDVHALVGAATDLLRNGTRLLLVWGTPVAGRPPVVPGRVLDQLARRVGHRLDVRPIRVAASPEMRISTSLLRRVWKRLRDHGLAVAWVGAERDRLADFAQRLVGRLGVRKLVLLDPGGGIANESGLLSFMDGAMLEELLRRGEAEWAGVGHRRAVLEAIRGALRGGVESVNLCDLRGVERELFTYEGAGTLFTLEDYCKVERLRVDDFREVERLIERGQREGYLRVRNAREIAEILMSGYGATIGARHLAGVGALATEPYRLQRAGEIVGLYTITRFKGEGVGGKLLARAIEDARQLGLHYLFACTTHDRARAFFERHGFDRVTWREVPATKWRTYPAERRRHLTVFKLPLAVSAGKRPRDLKARSAP